jgi:cytochrome c biogenesis protein CcmG/thiol:disulfide interchange protein DsbE
MLDAYYRARRDYGLRVFAITTEDSVPLAKMTKLFSVMAIDPVKRVRGPYEAGDAVPTNIIIDRAGVVRYFKAGAFNLDDLNTLLVPLLREPAPAAVGAAGTTGAR